jgi:hypothetical protein
MVDDEQPNEPKEDKSKQDAIDYKRDLRDAGRYREKLIEQELEKRNGTTDRDT